MLTVEVYAAHQRIHYLRANIFGNTPTSLQRKHESGLYTAIVEYESELHGVICALIERQRHLANSTNLAIRFRTLWVAAMLDESLSHCTDHEIGDLILIVQERFHIFEPEFGICEHAKRRLLLRVAKENLTR